MKPPRFAYERPGTLAEALSLLSRHGAGASILAGGQSLMPMLNLRMAQPGLLIDINRISGLDGIELRGDALTIGGRARHRDVLSSLLVAAEAPLLTQALSHVAHPAIRNRGTFGGSLALADPAAELPACALCLDASIIAVSEAGERSIPADEFFAGLYTTALQPEEMIVRVEIPRRGSGWRHGFDEVSRRRGDFAMAGLALAVRIDGRRIIESRAVFAGIETRPRRVEAVEAALLDAELGDEAAEAAALTAIGTLEAMDGNEIPADYRLHLARTLLKRLLARLAEEHDAGD